LTPLFGLAEVDACVTGNLDVDQYSSFLDVPQLSAENGKGVLSFVESGKEKPYTKEFAFIAAMIDLGM
jgi:hypothetical protein